MPPSGFLQHRRNPPSGGYASAEAHHASTNKRREGEAMMRLKVWIFRYGLLAALVLAAGAGKKWG